MVGLDPSIYRSSEPHGRMDPKYHWRVKPEGDEREGAYSSADNGS